MRRTRNPGLVDTDGDGFSDYAEVITCAFEPNNAPYRFNPRIADVALMTVVFAGPPVVTVQATDEKGVTYTVDDSVSDTTTTSTTNSTTNSQTRSDTLSASETTSNEVATTLPLSVPSIVDAGAAVDTGVAGDGARSDAPAGSAAAPGVTADNGSGATITLTNAVSTTVNPSTTFETSISFTQEQTQAYSRTLNRGESYAQSHNVTALAGLLKLAAVIQNRSDVAFRVTNILLAAAFVDGSGTAFAVQNLEIDDGAISNFVPFSLSPGEASGVVNFVSGPLTLDTTQSLLANARALQIRLAVYELSDANSKPLNFNVAEVGAKTAAFIIDYGSRHSPELYQVATNLRPERQGVTAAQVFRDILRIPYVAGDSGLRSVRGVGDDHGHWEVVRLHKEGTDEVPTRYGQDGDGYDFDSIELRAGDLLHLAFGGPGGDAPQAEAPSRAPSLGAGPPSRDGGLEVTKP